jgi:methyl-accepting chemotaxis protein
MLRLGVSARVTLMALVSVVVLAVVGGVGLKVISGGEEAFRDIHEKSVPGILALSDARMSLMKARVNVFQAIVLRDAQQTSAIDNLSANQKNALARLGDYERTIVSAEDKAMLEAERQAMQVYFGAINEKVIPIARLELEAQAVDIVAKETGNLGKIAMDKLDEHMAFKARWVDGVTGGAVASAEFGRNVMIGVMVAGLVVVVGLSWLIVRELRQRLGHMASFMIKAAESLDFTQRGKLVRMDELGKVGHAMNLLMDRLSASFRAISQNTEAVAAASAQLATSASQVAVASGQQSEASSNVAATVEEMTVSINHVGDRAHEADRLSAQSERLASEGGAVILQTATDIHEIAGSVRRAAELIEDLEASSKQISGVVAVIKEVADQTNLLALNAAIEAARAGEQGRGFAVVADEVRKLAERTGHSTQEIARTIEAMNGKAEQAVVSMNSAVGKVDVGVARARETSASIQQISAGCQEAVETVGEISEAIREQGSATNNIAAQIERIAQMSEESSAAAGETSDAARGLDELARKMLAEVSVYRFA